MKYEDDEIIESKIFDEFITNKIKLFAIVRDKNDAFIDLHFESHEKYYVLSHFNNFPNNPFVEIEEFDNPQELDFHKNEGCTYYKIDKSDQTLDYLKKDISGIHSNLFDLTLKKLEMEDITLDNKSNLKIDDKYIIKESDYYDITKELLNNHIIEKDIER